MIGLDTGWDGRWRQVRDGPRQWDRGPSTRWPGGSANDIQEPPHGGPPFPVRLVADLDLRRPTGCPGTILLHRHHHPLTDDLPAHPKPVPMIERQPQMARLRQRITDDRGQAAGADGQHPATHPTCLGTELTHESRLVGGHARRQVQHQQVDGAAGQHRAHDAQAVSGPEGPDHDQPAQVHAPLGCLEGIEPVGQVQPRRDGTARLRLCDRPQRERGGATRGAAHDGHRPLAWQATDEPIERPEAGGGPGRIRARVGSPRWHILAMPSVPWQRRQRERAHAHRRDTGPSVRAPGQTLAHDTRAPPFPEGRQGARHVRRWPDHILSIERMFYYLEAPERFLRGILKANEWRPPATHPCRARRHRFDVRGHGPARPAIRRIDIQLPSCRHCPGRCPSGRGRRSGRLGRHGVSTRRTGARQPRGGDAPGTHAHRATAGRGSHRDDPSRGRWPVAGRTGTLAGAGTGRQR